MSLEQFYNMCPRNFYNAQIGSKKLYEQNQQAEWERARWTACVIINPHLKRGIDPKKITTFPWEKVIKTTAQKKHDIEKIIRDSEYDDQLQKLRNNA